MDSKSDPSRFARLSFEDFRRLAKSPDLSEHEKVGFPDDYRRGREADIVADIDAKLLTPPARGGRYLDIGPGCSSIATRLVEAALRAEMSVFLLDSLEMLSELPTWPEVEKRPGKFPHDARLLSDLTGRVDRLLAYSVAHYAFDEGTLREFVAGGLALLAPGGRFLLGDVPNESKRRRFLASDAGREFASTYSAPGGGAQADLERGSLARLDDEVVASLILDARGRGYDAYWLPQPATLPMANRREDILFTRP